MMASDAKFVRSKSQKSQAMPGHAQGSAAAVQIFVQRQLVDLPAPLTSRSWSSLAQGTSRSPHCHRFHS